MTTISIMTIMITNSIFLIIQMIIVNMVIFSFGGGTGSGFTSLLQEIIIIIFIYIKANFFSLGMTQLCSFITNFVIAIVI